MPHLFSDKVDEVFAVYGVSVRHYPCFKQPVFRYRDDRHGGYAAGDVLHHGMVWILRVGGQGAAKAKTVVLSGAGDRFFRGDHDQEPDRHHVYIVRHRRVHGGGRLHKAQLSDREICDVVLRVAVGVAYSCRLRLAALSVSRNRGAEDDVHIQ
ncbi:hypothetical protein SDC9_153670 [bioreactor metagenome]|uniref:Uncharacterized protein n=1 Tax=bioreactor metagenome TaxID=1076179 RepID=A0A645F1B4_9ZZZZ